MIIGFDRNKRIEELYEKNAQMMYYTACRILGDKERAEDIVQEIFAGFLDKPPKFKSIRNLQAFLYIAVRNACFNALKKSAREKGTKEELAYLDSRLSTPDMDKETRTIVLNHICEQIESLPKHCREVCILVLIHNLSTEEVALRLNIKPQTVRNQKTKGIQKIKTSLLKNKLLYAFIFFIQLIE